MRKHIIRGTKHIGFKVGHVENSKEYLYPRNMSNSRSKKLKKIYDKQSKLGITL